MKFRNSLGLLALTATTVSASVNNPALYTFAENDIYSNPHLGTATSLTSIHFGYDFRPRMRVSDNGKVAFGGVNQDLKVWSFENGTTYPLGYQMTYSLDITTTGDKVLSGKYVYQYKGDEYKRISSLEMPGTALSSNGLILAGSSTGQGTGGNTIASYPLYTSYGREESVVFEWVKYSDVSYMEQLSRGFYEEVSIVDLDGSSEIMLTTLNNAIPGESYSSQDFTLMDKRGRYISAPFNVRYTVSLSNNGRSVLAYDGQENCPTYNALEPNGCAIIWNDNGQIDTLGNFQPHAMSGEADMVIGVSHSNNDTPFEAVIWDKQEGLMSFITYFQNKGIDLSGWSTLYPLDISRDGSKVTGYGINPDGNLEGFMIDLPAKKTQNWTTLAANDNALQYEGSFSEGTHPDAELIMSSSTVADTLTYEFTGSKVRVNGIKGMSSGYINIIIDDVLWGTYDTFDCSEPYIDVLFESDHLGEGKHELIIEIAGRKQAASQGREIGISSIEVESSRNILAPAPSYTTDSIPTPVSASYDFSFDRYNNLAYNTELRCSWSGCRPHTEFWYHHLYDKHGKDHLLSEVLGDDGSFSVEMWFKYGFKDADDRHYLSLRQRSLIEMYLNESKFGVFIKDKKLFWPGNTTGYSFEQTNRNWDHLTLSGNWQSGQIEIYLNKVLIGTGSIEANPGVDADTLLLGRILTRVTENVYEGAFAKYSVYDAALSSNQVIELFDWPTKYGLNFAPLGSPEYSIRLPGCSDGCTPGIDLTGLPIFGGAGGVGGIGTGGGF